MHIRATAGTADWVNNLTGNAADGRNIAGTGTGCIVPELERTAADNVTADTGALGEVPSLSLKAALLRAYLLAIADGLIPKVSGLADLLDAT